MSVHKAGAPYPPKADDNSQWQPFELTDDTSPFAVWTAPENVKTRALRITFSKGADDLLAEVVAVTSPRADVPAVAVVG